MILNDEYYEVSLSNSDDNDNSIHFIDAAHEFEYIEGEEVEQIDQGDEDDTEAFYTIEIDDEFDGDFENNAISNILDP